MARLGGGANGAPPAAAAPSQVTAQQEEDGRALYDVLAYRVASMTTAQQLAMGGALQRDDWDGIPAETRALFIEAARDFLDEGGA